MQKALPLLILGALMLAGAAGAVAFILIPGWIGIILGIAGATAIWCSMLAFFKHIGWF